MLNYIWLALVVIGILVAVGNDWHDMSVDKYHNEEQDSSFFILRFPTVLTLLNPAIHIPAKLFTSVEVDLRLVRNN